MDRPRAASTIVSQRSGAGLEQLPAAQLVKVLDTLTSSELSSLRDRELAGKHRITVLRRLERLLEKMPAETELQSLTSAPPDESTDGEANIASGRNEPSTAGRPAGEVVGGEEVVGGRNVDGTTTGVGAHCTNCGEALVSEMRFCGVCGVPIVRSLTAGRSGTIELGNIDREGRIAVKRRGVILVTAIAIAVVAIAAIAWSQLGNVTQEKHTIHGDMTLIDSTFSAYKIGATCSGTGGYNDIDEGASVKIKDQAGTLIGSGSLGAGAIAMKGVCVFSFDIANVRDAAFFQLEVSHRGQLSYSKADLEGRNWTIHSSLG